MQEVEGIKTLIYDFMDNISSQNNKSWRSSGSKSKANEGAFDSLKHELATDQ